MTEPIASLRELVGVAQALASSTASIARLLAAEVDAVEHQLRDYENALDHHTDSPEQELF